MKISITQQHRGTIEQTDTYIIPEELRAEYEALPENDRENWVLSYGRNCYSSLDVGDIASTMSVDVEEIRDLKLPGELIVVDGEDHVVVASVQYTDDQFVYLTMGKTPPYYHIAYQGITDRNATTGREFMDIVPAAEAYQDETGCW